MSAPRQQFHPARGDELVDRLVHFLRTNETPKRIAITFDQFCDLDERDLITFEYKNPGDPHYLRIARFCGVRIVLQGDFR